MVIIILFTVFSIFSILTICPNTVFAAAPAGVTVEYFGASSFIYANGNAITLKAGSDPDKTLIYLDSDPANPVELTGLEALGNTIDRYNLAGCCIYGGGYSANAPTGSTNVTVTGGTVAGSVHGGGTVKGVLYGGSSSSATVTGSTNVIFTGGTVDLYAGSSNGGVVHGGRSDAVGETNVTQRERARYC